MRNYKMTAKKLETALRLVMDCAGDIQAATNAELEAALACGDPDAKKQATAWLVAREALAQQVAVPMTPEEAQKVLGLLMLPGLAVMRDLRRIEAHHGIGVKP